jgi:uncharacterized membrane protein
LPVNFPSMQFSLASNSLSRLFLRVILSYVLNAGGVLMINGYFWGTMLFAYAVMALIVIVPLGATLYLFRRIVR